MFDIIWKSGVANRRCKKIKFIRFDRIHDRDGQTDGHRTTAYTALMHSIARQKTPMMLQKLDILWDRGLTGEIYIHLLSIDPTFTVLAASLISLYFQLTFQFY